MFRQCFLQSYREASIKFKFRKLQKDQFAKFGLPLINERRVFGAEWARVAKGNREANKYKIPAYLDRIK